MVPPLRSWSRAARAAVALVALAGCVGSEPTAAGDDAPEVFTEAPVEPLPHFLRVTPTIFNGGRPVGDAGLDRLRELGVKTVVSVEAMRPRVEAARARGLRYVHIPMDYKGIGPDVAAQLTRVMREAEGPIYFHCRHGTTRSVAASAVAKVVDEGCSGEDAVRVLERAGTHRIYSGLYEDVAAFRPPTPGSKLPELVEVARPSTLGQFMARIEDAYERLAWCRAAGWRTPPSHPDLHPVREAELLTQLLGDAHRKRATHADATFTDLLGGARRISSKLTAALGRGDAAAASARYGELGQSCKRCHLRYRN